MTKPLVRIQDLTKVFEKDKAAALDSISAQFTSGKIIGLAGPDAAGKTTLMRLMAGLLKPTSGTIEIGGFDTIKNAEQLHQIISYMPQKFGLYEDLSVLQNLNLYADLQGVVSKEKNAIFDKLLSFTGLKEFTQRLAGDLSGGMKQKLGLACTLLRKPKLLLLDEPTVGVDPISRRELWKMIVDLIKDDISVICSTAYLDEVEKCQEVMLLNEGKLLYLGRPIDLTEELKGKTFQIQGITGNHRQVLSHALRHPGIIDGVIQGSAVRLVLQKNQKEFQLDRAICGTGAFLQEVPPRFEDAFLNLLGGIRNKEGQAISPLASITPNFPLDTKPIIEAVNLTKKFDHFVAAENISFSVKRGEIFGLLGPNGAGKSTTFKMLCGLLKPTSGESFVGGVSLQEAPSQARARIGYMAQKFSLYGNMTARQNLRFFSGLYPLSKEDPKDRVEEMMEIFGLIPFQHTAANQLPLGYKQRLALSCSVMHHPEVLFLDEPTSGVDPITRREFWNHINALVEKGVAIIVTTHFMDEAEYCDRIGLINRGRLIRMGSPDELKNEVKTASLPSPTLEDAFIALSSMGSFS